MSKNFFFESKGPFKLNILFPEHSTSKIYIKDIESESMSYATELFKSICY